MLSGRLRKSNLAHFAAVCLTNVTQLTPALSKADFQILGTRERCTCRFFYMDDLSTFYVAMSGQRKALLQPLQARGLFAVN